MNTANRFVFLTGEVKCGTLEGRGGDKTANTTSITYRRV